MGGASRAGRGYLGMAGGGPEDTCVGNTFQRLVNTNTYMVAHTHSSRIFLCS